MPRLSSDGISLAKEPSVSPGQMCRQKAGEAPQLKAGRYGVFGTSAAISSWSNRELLCLRTV
jgi:hypothetical protein